MDGVTKNVMSRHILDVEDLHLLGKSQGFCPYYHSIESCTAADIIFMPYNYLVDDRIRPPSVNLSGSIVIFDEAHNIESVCCDSVSFELRAETLAQCISEVQRVLELNKSDEDCLASKEDLASLKSILLKVEEALEAIPIPDSKDGSDPSVTFPGQHIFEILKQADITVEVKDTIIDVAQDVLRELIDPLLEENAAMTTSSANRNSNKYGLETFVKAMETIFARNFNSDSFKVHVAIERQKRGNFMATSSRVLSLWCFNPGIAISGLKSEVHAMILTSGTLSPLQSFSSELQIAFPIRLENKHLIKPQQVYVGVLEKGPMNRVLSSEFKTRTTNEYMMELGSSLVTISRRIPFGMLVFFASYKHMEDCLEFWQRHRLGNLTVMEQLEKNKHVVSEPRGGGQDAVKQVFADYSMSLSTNGGAMMMAVMRGKVSEGMDFSDNFARCVVIAGIPYPYLKDPRITGKRQYMDQQCWKSNQNAHSKSKDGTIYGNVNGQAWYQQQAARAVNQAIGRVIRHRFDYGAILLADRRFAWSKNQESISSWVRPHIKVVKNFGLLSRDLTLFFKGTQQFEPMMKKKKANKEEHFGFIQVKRELDGIQNTANQQAIDNVFDANGVTGGDDVVEGKKRENQFKSSRKRKYSDTLDKMQKYISTPGANTSRHVVKRRKVNLAYDLDGAKPCTFGRGEDVNAVDLSFHGKTPTVAEKLRRRMERKRERKREEGMVPQNEMERKRARKLRIQSAAQKEAEHTNSPRHKKRSTKSKSNETLPVIKAMLNNIEYQSFKSVMKTLNRLKSSQSQSTREFDEVVLTPLMGLFGG